MKKLYVVGNRSSKSLSPTIFNYWFKKYNIKANYGFLELTENNFHKKIKEVLENKDTLGLNVTIPHKINVFEEQKTIKSRNKAKLKDLLEIPKADRPNWSVEEINRELENNAQGILGYVVRWIDQGI